MEVKALEQCK